MKNTNFLLDHREMASTERLKIFEQAIGELNKEKVLDELSASLDILFLHDTSKEDRIIFWNTTLFFAYAFMNHVFNTMSEPVWSNFLNRVEQGIEDDFYHNVIFNALDNQKEAFEYLLSLVDILQIDSFALLRTFFIALLEFFGLFQLLKPPVLNRDNNSLFIHGILLVQARVDLKVEMKLKNLPEDITKHIINSIMNKTLLGILAKLEDFSDKQLRKMIPRFNKGLAKKILDEEIEKALKLI